MSKNNDKIKDLVKSKTLHQMVLAEPDTYIGSVQLDNLDLYVFDDKTNKIKYKKDCEVVMGLYKIFDEILVNAADNTVRDKRCDSIKVNIDKKTGIIEVENNGSTIPVGIHEETGLYAPEMICSVLLSSGNYDKKGKIIGGKNGLGQKCVRSYELLPLYNGTIKKASDITLTDKLIGDDGKIRNIKKIITGKGQMYEVSQTHGESYTVNDEHILTLHMPDHKVIFWNSFKNGYTMLWWNHFTKSVNSKTVHIEQPKIQCPHCQMFLHSNLKRHYTRNHKDIEVPKTIRKSPIINPPDTPEIKNAYEELKKFSETIDNNNTFDMEIKDYMKLNKTTQSRLAGLRGVCVEWEKKEVELDPYVLGLWLGDGMQQGYSYACDGDNDFEIINYLTEWGKNNDAKITKAPHYTYRFSSINNFGKKGHAPLKKLLNKYNLCKEKHIPIEYLTNDRDTRLKVLAGIIDTDGNVSREGTRIIISQGLCHEQLIKDITFLARSLGFMCCQTIKKTSWTYNGVLKKGTAYSLNISGDIKDIPTLLPRKKCSSERTHSNRSTGQITIKDVGIDDYVGFEIDGNQRLLINDFTVTHNCTNIYSSWFEIFTTDTERHLKYYQKFSENMFKKTEPLVEKISKTIKDGTTTIRFLPDYDKFDLKKGLNDDMLSLFKKRVYDLAGTTFQNVKVYYNNELINVKSFEEYIGLYFEETNNLVYQTYNERWSIGAMYDPTSSFHQMSFVNNIATFKGGTHLNFVMKQIIDKVKIEVTKKNKELTIKDSQIKDNLIIFINSVIEDPKFGSQSKEELTTKMSDFKIKCEIDDKFISKICKSGLLDKLTNIAEINQEKIVDKTLNAKTNVSHPKLTDAKFAGTKTGYKCSLILTEGDSALALAKNGLDKLGRDYFGAFPLKGKLLNVREASNEQLLKNEEILNLLKIIGINRKTLYEDTKKLRYGRIVILTDQDLDGFHIKGLLMNFFHFFCPSLLKIDGFLQTIATPIVKVCKKTDTKKKNAISFFNERDYHKWEKDNESKLGYYNIKYYKGLGTSTATEAKEIFEDFDKKCVDYTWGEINTTIPSSENASENSVVKKKKKKNSIVQNTSNDKSDNALVLAFDKEYADNRKEWLKEHDESKFIDVSERKVTYHDYINKELILFSIYDNIRSLPSLYDGLKPSQRKIMYGAFKRNLVNEIKVAQLAGYISEHSGYHHGEMSLNSTIISMAQDYCGSNNINLLQPNGQFGTREEGGKNAASPRYIFTVLPRIIKKVFIDDDEYVIEKQFEEGGQIEPKTYYPIIPLILINGSEGIGTGYSTNVPQFNPLEIVKNLKLFINGTEESKLPELIPWTRGFTGKIKKVNDNKYENYGSYDIISENTIQITELPIQVWTNNYYVDLKNNETKLNIANIDKSDCTNNSVNIKVTFENNILQQLIKKDEIYKKLKLVSSINFTNMHLYVDNVIVKFDNPNKILVKFATKRLQIYENRKKYMERIYDNKLQLLIYKRKFMKEVDDETIEFGKKIPLTKVIEDLENKKYPKLSVNIENTVSYTYLTDLKIFNFTKEYIDDLDEEIKKNQEHITIYKNKTHKDLWIEELDDFLTEYNSYMKEWNEVYNDNDNKDDDEKTKTKSKTKSKSKSEKHKTKK